MAAAVCEVRGYSKDAIVPVERAGDEALKFVPLDISMKLERLPQLLPEGPTEFKEALRRIFAGEGSLAM